MIATTLNLRYETELRISMSIRQDARTSSNRGAVAKVAPAQPHRASAKSLRNLRIRRPKPGEDSASLVKQTVDALRNRILGTVENNRFLGSEVQLIAALGVSRPTFRQAARLLEHERLLKIKRGIKGGFFAQPPSAEAVSRLAAIFLNSQGIDLIQLTEATAPILAEAARLVAVNPDFETRRRVMDYVTSQTGFEKSGDSKRYARVILEFETLLGELSGNHAVHLILNVMRDLARDPRHSNFKIDDGRAVVYAEFCARLAAAIQEGDPDVAVLITKRHTAQIREWLADLPPDNG
jgi:GntR family transcriptional repressor for pyruvate dehydrogenase complex